jgi:uncharacterized protein YbjQ (UPF0145 family)
MWLADLFLRRADKRAVRAYERMLRSAPRDAIDRTQLDAFEKLTDAQLNLLFQRSMPGNAKWTFLGAVGHTAVSAAIWASLEDDWWWV